MLLSRARASHVERHLLLIGACLAVACGDAAVVPDAMLFDAGVDAFDSEAPDASDGGAETGRDAGFDSGRDVDVGMDTGGPDTSFDAGTDTGPTCECPASTLCLAQACIDGACVATPEPAGTVCGEMPLGVPEGVCLEGACVMRGCGDGYREPGPVVDEAPAREGCDDGNLLDGDACSPTCEPTLYAAIPGDDSSDVIPQLRGQRPALAVDDSGRVLATWLEAQFPTSSEEYVVLARRFTPEGVAVGDVIELVRGVGASLPVPVGLGEGWAVLHESSTVGLDGIVFRRVQVDGSVGAPRLVPGTGAASSPFATRHGDGVLTVWTRSVSGQNRVFARRLSASGMSLDTAEIQVTPPDVMRRADNPRVASIRAPATSGTGEANATALIAWRDSGGEYPTIYARRLRDTAGGTAFVDSAPFELPTDPIPFAGGCYVASLSAGATASDARFAVVWSGGEVMRTDTTTTIFAGRVMAREVTGSSAALPAQQVLATEQGGDNFPIIVAEPGVGASGEVTFVAAWHATTGAVIAGDHLPPEVSALRAAWGAGEETLGLVATPHAAYGPGIWVTSVDDLRVSPGLDAFLLPYARSR